MIPQEMLCTCLAQSAQETDQHTTQHDHQQMVAVATPQWVPCTLRPAPSLSTPRLMSMCRCSEMDTQAAPAPQ